MRIKLNYVFGIIVLGFLAFLTYYAQTFSPILVTFCGFVLAYMIVVFLVFVFLGRYGR
jgi:hypothetical protein